ncbi:hypothetical protein Trydic_g9723 [Trypoxylus dichotomus]
MAAGKIQPPEAADEYRGKVRTAIEKAKPKQIRQNISKAEERGPKELMSNKNINILPTDKRNATAWELLGTTYRYLYKRFRMSKAPKRMQNGESTQKLCRRKSQNRYHLR